MYHNDFKFGKTGGLRSAKERCCFGSLRHSCMADNVVKNNAGVAASAVGIVRNTALAAVKIVVGLLTRLVSVTADGLATAAAAFTYAAICYPTFDPRSCRVVVRPRADPSAGE